MAQRQAVFVRKDKPSGRAIKSDRAKVVMTAGCISKNFDITNYIYNSKEKQLGKSEFVELNWIFTISAVAVEDSKIRVNILTERYGFFDIISSFFYNN